jgi:5'-deoxynucleotidase YfbR-like HD superfamily hydrolase
MLEPFTEVRSDPFGATAHKMKQRLRDQIMYVRTGGHTERFHTKRTLTQDFVGHHSFNVAWLAHFMSIHLGQVERYTLLLAALEHDLPEQEFGDVPAPAKRGMGIREVWGEHERDLNHQMGCGYEDALSGEGKRILKIADAVDGMFHCAMERALGNQTMRGCFENFQEYAAELLDIGKHHERIVFELAQEAWTEVNNG